MLSMTKLLIVLSLLLVSYLAPRRAVIENDSLLHLLEGTSGDNKALTLLEFSRPYLSDSTGMPYLDEAFQSAVSDSVRGQVLYFKSFIHKNLGSLARQRLALKEALALLGDTYPTIRYSALEQLTRSSAVQGLYAEALEVALERLVLSETMGDRRNEAEAIIEVGYVYDRMGEYHHAISWYRKALPIANALNDDLLRGDIYGRTGIAYDELGDYEAALENNFKAVDFFYKAEQPSYARTWYSNIGNTYIKTGDLTKAELYTRKALEDPRESWRIVTLVNLGKIYLEQGRFADAQVTLDSAVAAALQRPSKRVLSEAYFRLHELRVKQNRYKDALAFYERYKKNEDEMLSEAKILQINELTVRYETYEKEKELLRHQARLAEQELEIRDRNAAIYGAMILIAVAAGAAFMIYRHQKLKNLQLRKEAELAEAQNEIESQKKLNEQRLHISRELHDNIGTYLTLMKTGLEGLSGFSENPRAGEVADLMKKASVELRHTVWLLNHETTTLEEIVLRIRDLLQFSTLNVAISADVIGNDQLELTSIQSTHLIRVIQEAVNNALKHGAPSQIDILIYGNRENISFEVRDNGKGFGLSDCDNGNGIRNMRYRLSMLSGTLEVDSNLTGGTRISGSFPVERNVPEAPQA